MERFGISSNSAVIAAYKDRAKNKNTVKATNIWLNCYRTWAHCRGKQQNIKVLPPAELDIILQQFFSENKKQDGKDYEPTSFLNMQASIERYLKEIRYEFSILNSNEFIDSRAVLEGKARTLREMGKGKRPNKACSLSNEELESLSDCGELGYNSPYSVVNTLWWQFTLHFGLRGRQEHHNMRMEHFEIKSDDNGVEYVTYAEGITKTRQSGLREKTRDVQPKMFATGMARCPVALFKFYRSKRPVELTNEGPFYLTVITNPSTDIWYKKVPMGVNYINNIMKNMIARLPLAKTCSKKLTNHSARRTLVKTLKKHQVPKCDIITITGHTTEADLDAYDSGDEAHQHALSLAIDNAEKSVASAPSVVIDTTTTTYNQSQFIISPDDPRVENPCFQFFPC